MKITDTPLVSREVSQRMDQAEKLRTTQKKQMDERLVENPSNAFHQSVAASGDTYIAEDAFAKWMKSQSQTSKEVSDPVADALISALDQFKDDKTFRLGTKGYVVKRSKGKGASGFIAQKVTCLQRW